MHFDITIIGAGAAGIEAALEAGRKGLTAALITNMPIGGRTAYAGLVPAQIMREAGRDLQHCYEQLGGSPFVYRPTLSDLKKRIEAAGDDWSRLEQSELEKWDIAVIEGVGKLVGPHEVEVRDDIGNHVQSIRSKVIILATGSIPKRNGTIAPNGDRILLPKQLKKMDEFPESILIIGAGPTGCEYASIFADLMVEVTLISSEKQLFSNCDTELVNELVEQLAEKGVELKLGVTVNEVVQQTRSRVTAIAGDETFTGHMALLCLGRTGDCSFTDNRFQGPGINEDGAVECDGNGQTAIPTIYAIGDLQGGVSTLVKARSSAQRCIETIVAELSGELHTKPKLDLLPPQVVNTKPPIGRIGAIPKCDTHCYHYYFSQLPLARIRLITGHLKIWVSDHGRIEYASVLGEGAEELLAIIRLAMVDGICFEDLHHCHYCSPSVAELFSRPPFKVEFQKAL